MARKINEPINLKKIKKKRINIRQKERIKEKQAPLHFTTQEILNCTFFYDNTLETSLEKAMDYEENTGGILTFPEFIHGVIAGGEEHNLYKNLISVYTEEHLGIDFHGTYYQKEEPILLTIHGGGLFTPKTLVEHKKSILTNGIITYSQKEFDMLLSGMDISGKSITMYTYEQIKEGINQLPHKFGVVTPYNLVKEAHSGSYTKEEFITNPLMISRSGNSKLLKKYFKYAHNNHSIECYHPFHVLTTSHPQGYLLFASASDSLIGYYGHESLGYPGHFVRIEKSKESTKI